MPIETRLQRWGNPCIKEKQRVTKQSKTKVAHKGIP